MAVVPDIELSTAAAETPPAAPFDELAVGIFPRARQSFAAVGGVAAGAELVVSDLSHVVVYRGSAGFPTINRGKRGFARTLHFMGSGDGLWRA